MRTPDFSYPPWVETVEETFYMWRSLAANICLEKEGPIYKYLPPHPKEAAMLDSTQTINFFGF